MPVAAALLTLLLAGPGEDLAQWRPARREAQLDWESRLGGLADPKRLSAYHDLLAGAPHIAGTPGDLKVAAAIAKHFRELGLEVEEQEIFVYLAHPVGALLEVNGEEQPLREEDVDGLAGHEELTIGWNAYSGSGDATAEVVFANYGTKDDFAKLEELGVDCKDKIVVARYGGNFRGYKAKFAEAAGAAGLVIYTDPYDAGFFKGLMYPEGGYANETAIQRGSILTLPYPGDPLTPFIPATKDAPRLKPRDVALPRIPVQPVGWKAARAILEKMKGPEVPDGWQGALPFRYRLTGGPDLKVRLIVRQERRVVRTVNVTGTLRGARFPEQLVIAGAHHDAWGFGAGDPTAGTILVLEAARCFAEAGVKPLRSIVFGAWAAEEYGVIGSTEWVEAHRERLSKHGVAYLNLDMAAMGPIVRSSAAPSLKRVIHDACAAATGKPLQRFGDLGGGSDHIGFYCHLAIPSAGLGGGGSKGVSYHSNYDNLKWYRQIVGADYEPAHKLTRILNRVLARLANGDILPLDPVQYGVDVKAHVAKLAAKKPEWDFAPVADAAARYEAKARDVNVALLATLPELDDAALASVNDVLLHLERAWRHEQGIPGRPWFRSLYAASDEDSGYAAWILPGLRHAVEHDDEEEFKEMRALYVRVLADLGGRLDALAALLR